MPYRPRVPRAFRGVDRDRDMPAAGAPDPEWGAGSGALYAMARWPAFGYAPLSRRGPIAGAAWRASAGWPTAAVEPGTDQDRRAALARRWSRLLPDQRLGQGRSVPYSLAQMGEPAQTRDEPREALAPIPPHRVTHSGIYSPPPTRARTLEEDYPPEVWIDGVPTDADGNLLYDVDGRRFGTGKIVGRSRIDRPNSPLSSEGEFGGLPERLSGKPFAYQNLGGTTVGATRAAITSGMVKPTQLLLDDQVLGPDESRILAHEIAHAIEIIGAPPADMDGYYAGRFGIAAGGRGTRADDSVSKQLRQIYKDLNYAPMGPRYTGDNITREYWAEAIRAYLESPDYIKNIAPDVARVIREFRQYETAAQ